MGTLAVVVAVLWGGLALAQAEQTEPAQSRLRVEFGLGAVADLPAILQPLPILLAALQWDSASLPLGFEVRLEPLQSFSSSVQADHVGRLQVGGRLITRRVEVALGVSALSAGHACENFLPPTGGGEVEECFPAAGLNVSVRVRLGDAHGNHLSLRGESLPFLSTRVPEPLAVWPSIGIAANLAITERLHLIADAEHWVLGYSADAGARIFLDQPGAVGTVSVLARAGWQLQHFIGEIPREYAGPRLILGLGWNL